MNFLCISDRIESMLHGPTLDSYAEGVDAVISCGDLPFEYLEYIVTFLGVPLYYVLGNHDPDPERKPPPGGCIPLDGRILDVGGGVVLAGLSGSPMYSGPPNQYTAGQMNRKALGLSARITARKLLGRSTPTVFVTHSPPFGLGDAKDRAHTGFHSYVDLIDRHHPSLWLHGHVHLYGPDRIRAVYRDSTKVLNVYGHQFVSVEAPVPSVTKT